MKRLVVLILLVASSCGDPECLVIPGPDVEAGIYQLALLRVHPDSVSLAGLPYADAQDLEIELSADGSTAVFRYMRDGVSVQETWSVTID